MNISQNINQQFFDNVSKHNIVVVREILTKYKDKVDINFSHNTSKYTKKTAIDRLFEDCSFYRDYCVSDVGFLKVKELIHLLVEHGAKINSDIIRSALWRATEPDETFLPLKLLIELRVDLNTIISNGSFHNEVKLDCLSYAFSNIWFQEKSQTQKASQTIQFLLLNGSNVTQTKVYLQTEDIYEKNRAKQLKDMAIHWELIMLIFCFEKKNCYFIWL